MYEYPYIDEYTFMMHDVYIHTYVCIDAYVFIIYDVYQQMYLNIYDVLHAPLLRQELMDPAKQGKLLISINMDLYA